jgi:hypothetical protein
VLVAAGERQPLLSAGGGTAAGVVGWGPGRDGRFPPGIMGRT